MLMLPLLILGEPDSLIPSDTYKMKSKDVNKHNYFISKKRSTKRIKKKKNNTSLNCTDFNDISVKKKKAVNLSKDEIKKCCTHFKKINGSWKKSMNKMKS